MKELDYHTKLKSTTHALILHIYHLSDSFPKSEVYGMTSQIRRASVSIMLNYQEGYARRSKAHLRNFLETSYGSLKEVKYLLFLAKELSYIPGPEYESVMSQSEEIGKMLWGIIDKL